MKLAVVLLIGALFALMGCKPPQIYEWGNYEGSLYALMKDPGSLAKYGLALQRQIENGEQSGNVPPGIYAEYGYFLTVTSQPGEAIKYYEKEKQRWPESARLMDKMISNCKAPKSAQAALPASGPTIVPPAAPGTATPAPATVSTPGKE